MILSLELSEKNKLELEKMLALEQGTELDTSDMVLSDKDYYEYRLNSMLPKYSKNYLKFFSVLVLSESFKKMYLLAVFLPSPTLN